jgi:hypothetical protein
VISVDESGTFKHFLSSVLDMAIGIILMMYGYFYSPIELIEKYKSAMPSEVGLLILSTGILLSLVTFTIKQIYKHIRKQNNVSDRGFILLFLLIILSILFFDYARDILYLAFSVRHDPLFDYFFKKYCYYMSVYYILLFSASLVFDKLLPYFLTDSRK